MGRFNRNAAFGERDAVFNRDAARHVAAREWRNGMGMEMGTFAEVWGGTIVVIRRSCQGDIFTILDLLALARATMRRRGNDVQWPVGTPRPVDVERDIVLGQSYLVEAEGIPVATFCLQTQVEPTYASIQMGGWPHAHPYATIHRLASDGRYPGIGRMCVDFCAARHQTLRADTHPLNYHTIRLLLESGFGYCGIIYLPDGTPRAAYQRG